MLTQSSLFDAPSVPTHGRAPARSELEAARRVAGKAGSEIRKAFGVIVGAGEVGASNREIQIVLWERWQPAWNKVATRTKRLEALGLVECPVGPDGARRTRVGPDGVETLLYRVTAHGREVFGLIVKEERRG